MAKRKTPDITEIALMQGIVKHLSTGEVRQARIAALMNLDVGTVRRIMLHSAFESEFKRSNAKAYGAWKANETSASKKEAVRTSLAADLPEFYQQAKDLIQAGDIKPEKKLDAILTLIKAASVLDEGDREDITTLSPTSLLTLKETLEEIVH